MIKLTTTDGRAVTLTKSSDRYPEGWVTIEWTNDRGIERSWSLPGGNTADFLAGIAEGFPDVGAEGTVAGMRLP